MTTWHEKEPLEEALWFFINVAYPDEAYADTCVEGIAGIPGNGHWVASVRNYLSDLGRLNKAVNV